MDGRRRDLARPRRHALSLRDAADPHLDEAWLLKAACLPKGPEQLACLQAALTVNPGSVKLKKALEIATARAAAV